MLANNDIPCIFADRIMSEISYGESLEKQMSLSRQPSLRKGFILAPENIDPESCRT